LRSKIKSNFNRLYTLKYAGFILVFCISRLFSQINAPDLRCLEVLPNGEIKLTWIPPNDPGNQFSHYEVYFATSKQGPYSLLNLTLTALPQTSVIHVTTTGTIQPAFYFMRTRFGATGSSGSSDTLRTIFLNIFPSDVLKLSYNYLHEPKLPTTSATFAIDKEFPLGIWNNLANTSAIEYHDTITSCKFQKINYQVTLADASGCFSRSNIQGGDYKDDKKPSGVFVDSISVLPNGNTILSWAVPSDIDIRDYEIQHRVNSANTPIDTVYGRNSTFYLFNTQSANSNTVGLFVRALDSCDNGSIFVDYNISTISLTVSYIPCAYQTIMTWNEYQWPKYNNQVVNELLEYRIYYSVNGSAFVKVGATKDRSFTHNNVNPNANVTYFVRAVNVGGTKTSSSNRKTIYTFEVEAPNFVYIKTASILNNNSAVIKLLLDTSEVSNGIDVYRAKDTSGDFQFVGFIPYNGQPHYEIIDDKIESNKFSYSYKAKVKDSCGNPRTVSNTAKTILLKVSEDAYDIFTRHLSWTQYDGFSGGVSGYNILRVMNDNINPAPVGTTGPEGTSFTDNLEIDAPNGAKIEYIVQAVEGVSNVYGLLEESNSNPAPVYIEGRLYVPNTFVPSGKNNTWRPITHFIDKADYRVTVFNRWGNVVFDTTDDKKEWDGANCIPGVYVYLIKYKVARGEYKELKGTVQLLR
jgi:hypothetical protein